MVASDIMNTRGLNEQEEEEEDNDEGDESSTLTTRERPIKRKK